MTATNPAKSYRPVRDVAADESGAVAVEVAIATPFLVLLTAGIVEYGSMMYSAQLLQAGVRDAARYLATLPGLPTAPAAARQQAEARARQLAVTGTVASGGRPRVQHWTADEAGVAIAYAAVANPRDAATGLRAYRGDDAVYVVRVTGRIDHPGIGLLQAIRVGPVPVNAVHEERHVAP